MRSSDPPPWAGHSGLPILVGLGSGLTRPPYGQASTTPLEGNKKKKPLGWRVAEIGSTRCARLRRDESEDERTNTETNCATELRDGLNKPLG